MVILPSVVEPYVRADAPPSGPEASFCSPITTVLASALSHEFRFIASAIADVENKLAIMTALSVAIVKLFFSWLVG